jgi:ASC-1-like (ASCH) protein
MLNAGRGLTMKRTFYVRAVWDADVKKYYTESDILGLAIETKTLDEFEEVLNEVAIELIMSNHMSTEDLISNSIRDLVPTIIWQRPTEQAAAA